MTPAQTFIAKLTITIGKYENDVTLLLVADNIAAAEQELRNAARSYYGEDADTPAVEESFEANDGEVRVHTNSVTPVGLSTFLELKNHLTVRCHENEPIPTEKDFDALAVGTAEIVSPSRPDAEKAKVEEILQSRWADVHQLAATREGWDLWTSFGSEYGPLQVQRFDDVEEAQAALDMLCIKLGTPGQPLPTSVIPSYDTDDDVHAILVCGTEPHHIVAMAILDECSPMEAKFVRSFLPAEESEEVTSPAPG